MYRRRTGLLRVSFRLSISVGFGKSGNQLHTMKLYIKNENRKKQSVAAPVSANPAIRITSGKGAKNHVGSSRHEYGIVTFLWGLRGPESAPSKKKKEKKSIQHQVISILSSREAIGHRDTEITEKNILI